MAANTKAKKPNGAPVLEQPAPKSVDLASLQESPEGKELLDSANKLREQCLKLGLPIGVRIGGVAPFAAEFEEQIRAQGFIDGRQYERINGQYSKVIGAKSNEIH